jgi:hypothetical protein
MPTAIPTHISLLDTEEFSKLDNRDLDPFGADGYPETLPMVRWAE